MRCTHAKSLPSVFRSTSLLILLSRAAPHAVDYARAASDQWLASAMCNDSRRALLAALSLSLSLSLWRLRHDRAPRRRCRRLHHRRHLPFAIGSVTFKTDMLLHRLGRRLRGPGRHVQPPPRTCECSRLRACAARRAPCARMERGAPRRAHVPRTTPTTS